MRRLLAILGVCLAVSAFADSTTSGGYTLRGPFVKGKDCPTWATNPYSCWLFSDANAHNNVLINHDSRLVSTESTVSSHTSTIAGHTSTIASQGAALTQAQTDISSLWSSVRALQGSSSAATPTCTSLSVTTAPVGATVIAYGTNLNGTSGVMVNGQNAAFSGPTTTQVSFTVPSTTTGAVNILVSGGLIAPCGTLTIATPVVAPSIYVFTATPSGITAGQSATLTWSVSGATSLSIDQSVGTVTGTTKAVTPAATTTYTLTATNAQGSVTAQTTVVVSDTSELAARFTVRPQDFASCKGSKVVGDGTADDCAVQGAIDSLPLLAIANPYFADPTTRGGGTVLFPKGVKYKVTASIKVPGGVCLQGEGPGSVIEFAPPTTDGAAIINDPDHYTVNGITYQPCVRGLSIHAGSDHALDGIRFVDAQRAIVEDNVLSEFRRYGLFFDSVTSETACYHRLANNTVFDTPTSLYVGTLCNGVLVNGDSYQHNTYDPAWPGTGSLPSGASASDYMVEIHATGIVLNNVDTEGNPTLAKIFDDLGGVTVIGGWQEARGTGAVNTPIVALAESSFEASTEWVNPTQHRFTVTPWPLSSTDADAQASNNAFPFAPRIGSPHFTEDLIPNPGKYGLWGWELSAVPPTWDATVKAYANGRGSIKLNKTGADDIQGKVVIPAARLAKYLGRRLYVTASIRMDNWGTHPLDANGPAMFLYAAGSSEKIRWGLGTNSEWRFGTGTTNTWRTIVADIPILSGDDIQVAFRNKSAATAMWVTDVFAWLDGYDYLPVDRSTKLTAAAAPTTGAWVLGDTVYNSSPAGSGAYLWTCTTAGTDTAAKWSPLNLGAQLP